ncbi:MAG: M16 family metallopeptidase [Rickettsiales bacterium]
MFVSFGLLKRTLSPTTYRLTPAASPLAIEGYARLIIMVCAVFFSSAAQAAIEVETTSIGHGVKAWYAPNDAVPVVDVVMSFEGAGSASDPEGKSGRAAFAASMLTEGAGTMDSSAFRRAMEEKAITIEMNTDEDRLTVHVYCLREHAKRAGELLALALSQPPLAEADQARMKSDLSSMLARLNERPAYRASRLLTERAFKGHPYANSPYGDAASLASLNAEDVKDYLRTYVTRGNVLIAASGDVDASLLDDMLDPVVDALASNDSGAVAVTQTALQGQGETLKAAMDVPQTTVLFAAPAIARDDPRFYAQYLLNHVLGGSALFSRLGNEVRQKKGLVYSIDSDLDMKRGSAVIGGSLGTRNATADEAVSEVKQVLSDIHLKGVTTHECTDAKSYVIGAIARQMDSSTSVARLLLTMQIHKLGEDYIEKRDSLFTKVSCADINAVAAEVLNPANFVFAIVGGKPEVGGTGPIPVAAPAHNDVK